MVCLDRAEATKRVTHKRRIRPAKLILRSPAGTCRLPIPSVHGGSVHWLPLHANFVLALRNTVYARTIEVDVTGKGLGLADPNHASLRLSIWSLIGGKSLHHQHHVCFRNPDPIPSSMPSAMSSKRSSLAHKNHVGLAWAKYL